MGRRLSIAVAVVGCVALFLLLKHEATPRGAPLRGAPLEDERPAAGAVPPDPPEPPGEALPSRKPTFLAGHVYGPDGNPVGKAEVRVVHPKTYELTRSVENGAYQLRFECYGRFLIEAALTTELAPERAWADIPEEGDPAPLDFRLEPARGAVFGELTLGGVPVEALVELYASDVKPVLEVSTRWGCFNFYLDPPKDVPLRLEVRSSYGMLPAPVPFTWTGRPLDLGKLELTPYPTARIRMRLPDGTYAKGVWAVPRETLRDLQFRSLEEMLAGFPPPESRLVPSREDVTTRCVFVSASPSCMAEREVKLLFGRPQDFEVIVRPGPIVVASRLLDREGRGLRGRLRCGESEAATGDDGAFRLAVPHGGIHVVHLVALDVSGIGPVELAHGVPTQSVLLDADDPADCAYDVGGRVLLLATAPYGFKVTQTFGKKNRIREVWSADAAEGAKPCRLSFPLTPGPYLWTCDDTRGRVRSGELRVEEGAMAVVDAR